MTLPAEASVPHRSTRYVNTEQSKSEKPLPELYSDTVHCCGCTACASSCPVKAIRMTPDDEGFCYPAVDAAVCIRCGKCMKVCAFQKHQRGQKEDCGEPAVYAVKHRDEAVRAASRSGGIFTALSDAVLNRQGAVYGCALTEDFRAVHIRAASSAERDRLRGSKYVQSDLGDVFSQVRADLQAGLPVLFTGTSCQVAGLRAFLGKAYDNLYCADILCNSVPSPLVWQRFLSSMAERAGSPVREAVFRNKAKFGWKAHTSTLRFANGKTVDTDDYRILFSRHYSTRLCCTECPYKSVQHPGDITLGDYWGIEKACPGFSDNKGVSLVLVNNEQGSKLWNQLDRSALEVREAKLADSIQPMMQAPCPAAPDRAQFWADFERMPFDRLSAKYGKVSLKIRIKRKLKKLLGRH